MGNKDEDAEWVDHVAASYLSLLISDIAKLQRPNQAPTRFFKIIKRKNFISNLPVYAVEIAEREAHYRFHKYGNTAK